LADYAALIHPTGCAKEQKPSMIRRLNLRFIFNLRYYTIARRKGGQKCRRHHVNLERRISFEG